MTSRLEKGSQSSTRVSDNNQTEQVVNFPQQRVDKVARPVLENQTWTLSLTGLGVAGFSLMATLWSFDFGVSHARADQSTLMTTPSMALLALLVTQAVILFFAVCIKTKN